MKIIDRYISKSVVLIFLCTLLIFFLLYLLIDSACQLDEFINRKVPFKILVEYYLNYFPIILVQIGFYTFLIAVLLAYTNLHTHNEIIALRASGLNFWQLALPAIYLSLVFSALIFYVNERYIPDAEIKARDIRNNYMIIEEERLKKRKTKINNLTFYGLGNRLYFVDTFDPNTYDMQGITIVEFNDEQNVQQKIVAYSGKWTGIAWKFQQCQVTTYSNDQNTPTKVRVYEEKLMNIKEIETPEEFLKQRVNPNTMNIKQLSAYIRRFSKSGARRVINNLNIDLYQKFVFPFSNIIIMLVGLPIALMNSRRKAQSFIALGIALGVGFAFHVSHVLLLALGKGGLLHPLLAAWGTPVIFFLFALYLIQEKY